jgi:hypothetical protein
MWAMTGAAARADRGADLPLPKDMLQIYVQIYIYLYTKFFPGQSGYFVKTICKH